ncbi:MAG: hypothetical protein GY756_09840 [bacterium]|nr:hypothetical protein [bacterium]
MMKMTWVKNLFFSEHDRFIEKLYREGKLSDYDMALRSPWGVSEKRLKTLNKDTIYTLQLRYLKAKLKSRSIRRIKKR